VDLKDFYFSAKHQRHLFKMSGMNIGRIEITKFNGKIYTECTDAGMKPISNFDDLVLLGTGTWNNLSSDGNY
jgi:hypothetical protein